MVICLMQAGASVTLLLCQMLLCLAEQLTVCCCSRAINDVSLPAHALIGPRSWKLRGPCVDIKQCAWVHAL